MFLLVYRPLEKLLLRELRSTHLILSSVTEASLGGASSREASLSLSLCSAPTPRPVAARGRRPRRVPQARRLGRVAAAGPGRPPRRTSTWSTRSRGRGLPRGRWAVVVVGACGCGGRLTRVGGAWAGAADGRWDAWRWPAPRPTGRQQLLAVRATHHRDVVPPADRARATDQVRRCIPDAPTGWCYQARQPLRSC